MHRKRLLVWLIGAPLLCLGAFSNLVLAHEIVGQVTPLMIHMKRALLLIQNGKEQAAVLEIETVYEDFSHDMGMGMTMDGVGLKTTARQIDLKFGTRLEAFLSAAIHKKDASGLQTGVQTIAFLLMLEKFNALQDTFAHRPTHTNTPKTIYWLGRNYFSYLLEPTLAKTDPVQEKRLDQLLDKMLYRLEDNRPEAFVAFQKELEQGISAVFNLNVPIGGRDVK